MVAHLRLQVRDRLRRYVRRIRNHNVQRLAAERFKQVPLLELHLQAKPPDILLRHLERFRRDITRRNSPGWAQVCKSSGNRAAACPDVGDLRCAARP
ncbi:hypothetical protein D3C81_2077340 [compost metagenome]